MKKFALSQSQKRFWLEWKLDPDTVAYNTPLLFEMEGNLNKQALFRALDTFVNRCDAGCRTAFMENDDQVYQVRQDSVPCVLEEKELSGSMDEAEREAFIQKIILKKFDLTKPPLFHFGLMKLAEQKYNLVLNFHHIISDALSAKRFIPLLAQLYNHFAFGDQVIIEENCIADYINYEQRIHLTEEKEPHLSYWENLLKNKNLYLDLPHKPSAVANYVADSYFFNFDDKTTHDLKCFARQSGTTPFIVLSAIFGVLLARYSGENHVVLNYPIDTRIAQFKNLIGCFVNHLPCLIDLQEKPTFAELIKQLTHQRKQTKSHQHCSLTDIVARLREKKHLLTQEFLNVSITEAHFNPEPLALKNLVTRSIKCPCFAISNELALAYQMGEKLEFRLDYRTAYFDPLFIKQLFQHFVLLVQTCLSRSNECVNSMELLTDDETQKLKKWESNDKQIPIVQTVLELFTQQVRRTPTQIAVSCHQSHVTFSQLNDRANQLAREIQRQYQTVYKQNIPRDTFIGICLPRGLDFIIAILAVLKTNSAYIPLDPTYPLARLKYMVEDSCISLLIGHDNPSGLTINEQFIDLHSPRIDWNKLSCDELPMNPSLSDLAYLIYTSGSTGQPKGVMIEHASLSNIINDFQDRLKPTDQDIWVSGTSPSFDIFGLELFLPLITGCRLVLLTQHLLENAQDLKSFLAITTPTIMQATPAFWSMLTAANWSGDANRLTILSGGEELSQHLLSYLRKIAHRVFNVYGPTETTIWSSCIELTETSAPCTLGKPITNTHFYVLDEAKKRVPIGVIGELYIGGKGVARGYWQQEKLTHERFASDKVSLLPNDRLYRTGDRVCWLADGNLYYIGRADSQVKVRGYRLELGEIEQQIMRHPAISQCVVLAKGATSEKYLIAYLVLEPNLTIDGTTLRDFLASQLPQQAIPGSFTFLAALPLLPNGKIDKQKLPSVTETQAQQQHRPPNTQEEKILLAVWEHLFPNMTLGIEAHFFQLGGHSLLATQMATRLQRLFDKEIPVKKIFDYPTIESLAKWISTQISAKQSIAPETTSDNNKLAPLSLSQRYLWFIDQYEENSSAFYNLMVVQHLKGVLNLSALQASLNQLIARHAGLRTTFQLIDGQPYQIIHPVQAYCLTEEVITAADVTAILEKEAVYSFDLTRYPLLRIRLLHLSPNETIFVFIVPHMIADGWSFSILRKELMELYAGVLENRSVQLPAVHVQYSDFSNWQHTQLKGQEREKLSQFWQTTLADYPVLHLPTDRPRPAVMSHQGGHYRFQLDLLTLKQLKIVAEKGNGTLFSLLLATFSILLYRYSHDDDLVIATASANRSHEKFENTVGLFVNTLALRLKLKNNPTFNDLLTHARDVTLAAYDHQALPFEIVVDLLQAKRDPARSPLTQVMIVLQNANEHYSLDLPGIESEPVFVETHFAKLDLILTLHEGPASLGCDFEYASDLFDSSTISRMAEHYLNLLHSIIADPNQTIQLLHMLSANETQLLMSNWNRPSINQVMDKTLSQLFEEQVQRTPNNIAIKCSDQVLTYAELNSLANQLAHVLRSRYQTCYQQNLLPDTLIGLCLERDPMLIVGILGILKAGGAYVPLDPAYPQDRLNYMMSDSAISLLVTQRAIKVTHPFSDEHLIYVDDLSRTVSDQRTLSVGSAHNLAYVIYTSGSTGQPKGTLLTHSNVTRLFASTKTIFNFSPTDVWCLFHSFAFDFSVWEIWGALLHGASLIIIPYSISRTPKTFYQLLQAEKVTVLNQTPSAFTQLMNVDKKEVDKLPLRYVIFGGEALHVQSLRSWFAKYGEKSPSLINMYGITETTVHVTWHVLTPLDFDKPYCNNIGRPLPDLSAYVMDEQSNPVPIGVNGELYIAGPGLARGYLNRDDLTKKIFCRNKQGTRLYKTGDVVRWLPDGCLEYIGRIDNQLKIRGFRIESGEIEAALLQYPDIDQAAVVVDNDKRLIAYYVSDNPAINEDTLYQALRQRLPDYMMPAIYIRLLELPLTKNGKIDSKALPIPDSLSVMQPFVAPQTEVEHKLADIWRKILQLDRVGIKDNFFALGGDSIRSISVIAAAKERGLSLSAKDLFLYPTIAGLSVLLQNTTRQEAIPIINEPYALINATDRDAMPVEVEDAYPLSELQRGMIYYSELSQTSSTYIDVVSCYVLGEFNEVIFNNVLQNLVKQHEVLRTSFALSDFSQALQLVHQDINIPCDIRDLRIISAEEQTKSLNDWLDQEIQTHFIFPTAPLWRITISRLQDKKNHFGFTCHHAILDGWSVALLLTQLFSDYDKALSQEIIPVQKPKIKYNQFIAQEKRISNDAAQQQFWQKKIVSLQPTLLALNVEKAVESRLKRVFLTIPQKLSAQLYQTASTHQCPIDTILLAVHLRVLAIMTGRSDVVTGLATHGRPAEQDGDKVLGLFLNSTPFCLSVDEVSWPVLIKRIITEKQQLLDYAQYPLSRIQKQINNQPLFDTLFNFINFHVFDQLKQLRHLRILPATSYEKTNYTLIAQSAVNNENNQLEYQLVYHSNGIDEEQITLLRHLYQCCLESVASEQKSPNTTQLLPYMAWAKKNNQETTYPKDKTIHQLFAEQAIKTPLKIAVIADNLQVTYGDLNARANQLAAALTAYYKSCYQQTITADTLIGISIEPGIQLIISILAILKTGAAYLPLDRNYPEKRLQEMIAHSSPKLLLVDGLFPLGITPEITVVNFDELSAESINYSTENSALVSDANSLAYVMYTSGSTGKPKGVMIEHHSVVRLVKNTNYISIQSSDCFAQASNANFDAFTFELWGALLNGATLVCVPRSVLIDFQEFGDFIARHAISILWLSARLLDQFVHAGHTAMFKDLRYLLAGGDILTKATIRRILECPKGSPQYVLNGYGPTENTTFTTVHHIKTESLTHPSIPIGQAIAHTQIYVLSEQMKYLPNGVAGDLYVAGEGLARGYYCDEELTNSRFIANPFVSNSRLYKTGDRVRSLANGELEFLGRSDRQMKIRGFRIELDEVEALISAHAEISQCWVSLYNQGSDKKLIAYCVTKSSLSIESLRTQLRQEMPEHFIPTYLILLDEFPLTANGKIDVDRLPQPKTLASSNRSIFLPKNETEEKLAQIWGDVLGSELISVKDNFFDLGGDSLLAMQLHSKLQSLFHTKITITDLFQYPTIEYFAQFLMGNQPDDTRKMNESQERRNAFRKQQRIKKSTRKDYVSF